MDEAVSSPSWQSPRKWKTHLRAPFPEPSLMATGRRCWSRPLSLQLEQRLARRRDGGAGRRVQEPRLGPRRAAILGCVGFRDARSAASLPEVPPIASLGPRPSVRLEPGGVPGGSGGGGRMSAEAADREAATSSRPCTPPQTCWFEFLLEESLLEKHLRKPCPGRRGACSPGKRDTATGDASWASSTRSLLSQPRGCGPGGAHRSPALARPSRYALSV